MKKVLMISYVWPPMEGVGLIRAMKFAKYLPRYGWEPVVLTVKCPGKDNADNALSSNAKVFRTEYRDVVEESKSVLKNLKFWHRKSVEPGVSRVSNKKKYGGKNRVASAIREFVAMPDEQAGWYEFAVSEGKKIMDKEGIDLIFSTSPPETSHLIARTLKQYCALPWVADLRDLWAEDHYRVRPALKKALLRSMEQKTFKDADRLVTVSEPWAKTLRSNIGPDKVMVIENGFDEEDFKDIPYGKNEKFTIVYTGKLHKEYQSVDIFFKAVAGLIKGGAIDRDKIEIRFYILGYDRPDVGAIARQYGLNDIIREMDGVSYARSLEIQRSSDALLFVQWTGRGSEGWYSAKLYDYLGAQRPILALAKKGGIIEGLINKTTSGVVSDDVSDLKEKILQLYGKFIKGGPVECIGNGEELSKHTRLARTAELADIFNSFSKGAR